MTNLCFSGAASAGYGRSSAVAGLPAARSSSAMDSLACSGQHYGSNGLTKEVEAPSEVTLADNIIGEYIAAACELICLIML